MNKKYIIVLSIVCGLVGMVLLALHREWLIIHWPSAGPQVPAFLSHTTHKKKVTLFFWHHQAWYQEVAEIVWSQDITENIINLVVQWLTLVHEEQLSKKRVGLEAVMLGSYGQVYISFDRNPIAKQAPNIANIMWFESLLKTVRENGILLQGVYFMAHHQPLQDVYLDFSHAWPLTGFVEEKVLT
jgi:hypothetical protein